jgi:hypothetical protein
MIDKDGDLLLALEISEATREARGWTIKRSNRQRFENAAKEAHIVRNTTRLKNNEEVVEWDDLGVSSIRHLIADAENVATNLSITAEELHELYKERLIAWGDTENPDLAIGYEDYASFILIEKLVLEKLKTCLASTL